MTQYRTLFRLPLFALVLSGILAGSSAMAQEATHEETFEIEKELLPELGRLATGYWVPKLNAYRVKIDRALPAFDQQKLEALRVQWGIVMEKQAEQAAAYRREAEAAESRVEKVDASMADTVATVTFTDEVTTIDIREPLSEEGPLVDATPDRVPDEARPVEVDPTERTGPSESDLFEATAEIAGRNRAQMNTIGRLVRSDMEGFFDRVIILVDEFHLKNRDRLIAGGNASALDDWQTLRAEFTSPEGREKVLKAFDEYYAYGVESFIMLYHGEDIFRLLGVAIPASAPLVDMTAETSSMLAQNVPNPAGSGTRISYTLAQPSSSTAIEIFDATGSRLMTLDQGARPAGEHTAVVDVSKLPTGSYLYRLTLQSEQGEQVSSRVMQVVR